MTPPDKCKELLAYKFFTAALKNPTVTYRDFARGLGDVALLRGAIVATAQSNSGI
jgi:hypothetical protein